MGAPADRRWRTTRQPGGPARPGLARPCPPGPGTGVDWLRTLVAKGPARLRSAHLRHRQPPQRTPALHLIALDASGSMRQQGRLGLAKGYAARLIEQAARAGDQVALLAFGGQGVQWLLPPGPARASGSARVRPLGGGGGTPLSASLDAAARVLQRSRRGATGAKHLWLLTDGRCLEQPAAPAGADRIVVVDFDDPLRPVGRCADWAARWGAEHRRPDAPLPPAPPHRGGLAR